MVGNQFAAVHQYPQLSGGGKSERRTGETATQGRAGCRSYRQRGGSVRAANIVMLGAAAPFIGIEYDKIADGIRRIFGRKGEEIVEMNLKALKAGYDVAQSMQK